jgi:hypothetical protein
LVWAGSDSSGARKRKTESLFKTPPQRGFFSDIPACGRKKTGPKAGFYRSLPITWREQREQQQEQQQEQQRQRERRVQQPEQQRQQPERQARERRREPEQPSREREQRLLSCHKQTGTEPSGRRAGRYISFECFLEKFSQHVDY